MKKKIAKTGIAAPYTFQHYNLPHPAPWMVKRGRGAACRSVSWNKRLGRDEKMRVNVWGNSYWAHVLSKRSKLSLLNIIKQVLLLQIPVRFIPLSILAQCYAQSWLPPEDSRERTLDLLPLFPDRVYYIPQISGTTLKLRRYRINDVAGRQPSCWGNLASRF